MHRYIDEYIGAPGGGFKLTGVELILYMLYIFIMITNIDSTTGCGEDFDFLALCVASESIILRRINILYLEVLLCAF